MRSTDHVVVFAFAVVVGALIGWGVGSWANSPQPNVVTIGQVGDHGSEPILEIKPGGSISVSPNAEEGLKVYEDDGAVTITDGDVTVNPGFDHGTLDDYDGDSTNGEDNGEWQTLETRPDEGIIIFQDGGATDWCQCTGANYPNSYPVPHGEQPVYPDGEPR